MIRRIGLILALLATLLPVSALIPGLESTAAAATSTLPQTDPSSTEVDDAPISTLTNGNVRIAAGNVNTCAILSNGTVKCWGSNSYGQLGNGTSTSTNTPGNSINLGTGRTATAIAAGLGYTCAILDNGTVTCWGENSAGQLGNGKIGRAHV